MSFLYYFWPNSPLPVLYSLLISPHFWTDQTVCRRRIVMQRGSSSIRSFGSTENTFKYPLPTYNMPPPSVLSPLSLSFSSPCWDEPFLPLFLLSLAPAVGRSSRLFLALSLRPPLFSLLFPPLGMCRRRGRPHSSPSLSSSSSSHTELG